ncbi:type II toxin-antitoxin system HicB family antitoxin [Draconibacterium sp.]|uniref:type II toxin-antitoxin system HicB family antitoxin n=1 Tax=Draconibacterium sp. TaxID=1965318 RepID=UPI003561EC43
MKPKEIRDNEALVILEKSEDGYWARVDALPGCYSFGETPHEAINNTREAIAEHIEGLIEINADFPEMFTREYAIKIKYDLQSLFETFKFINVSAFAELAGINASLLRQYAKGITTASEKQKAKIESALHKVCNDLESACL